MLLLVLAIVLMPVTASAAPKDAWCRMKPGWTMCRVAPMAEEEPVEYLPMPQVTPQVTVSNRPMPPVTDAPAPPVVSPPIAEPEPAPKHAPVVVAKPRPAPAKAQPKVRVIEPRAVERPRVRVDDGPGLPVGCGVVCAYARSGSGASMASQASPRQRREGLACIRSQCPDVLRRGR